MHNSVNRPSNADFDILLSSILYRSRSALAGTDPDHILHLLDEDLSVSHMSGRAFLLNLKNDPVHICEARILLHHMLFHRGIPLAIEGQCIYQNQCSVRVQIIFNSRSSIC